MRRTSNLLKRFHCEYQSAKFLSWHGWNPTVQAQLADPLLASRYSVANRLFDQSMPTVLSTELSSIGSQVDFNEKTTAIAALGPLAVRPA